MTNVLAFPSNRVDYRPRILTELRLYQFERPEEEEALPMSVYFSPLTFLLFGAIAWMAVRA